MAITGKLIKKAINFGEANKSIKALLIDNTEVEDQNIMAEEFNVYFTSNAERLQNDIPSVDLSPINYVNCNMHN